MRRAEREITDPTRAFDILSQARVARIAYADSQGLTIVPVTFTPVEEQGAWYLLMHGAKGGRKYEAWKGGLDVAFEAEAQVSPVVNASPALNSWRFLTVVGNGRIEEVTDEALKHRDLARLLVSHIGRAKSEPLPEDLSFLACYRLRVHSWAAKQNGFA